MIITIALTPSDIDLAGCKINIAKTWNYKSTCGGFAETKNQSSKRIIHIDKQTCVRLLEKVEHMKENQPIFVNGRVFNSTVNNRLKALCRMAKAPVISIHSLRHTHASLLIYAGVSIASVAKRLGYSSVTTTQETYFHIIKELETQDNEKILNHLYLLV